MRLTNTSPNYMSSDILKQGKCAKVKVEDHDPRLEACAVASVAE
jgi:hypothetical protein